MQGATIKVGLPVPLFPTRIVGGGRAQPPGFDYTVARDGRFLINILVGDPPSSPMTLLLNWKPKR